jgi:exodeoxyribonuclease III
MDFYETFLEYTESLRRQGRELVICGDVNTAHKPIDLARPKENEKVSGFLPVERDWLDKLVEHGYVDTFRRFNKEPDQYTWWDMKTGRGNGISAGESITFSSPPVSSNQSPAPSSCPKSKVLTTVPSALL